MANEPTPNSTTPENEGAVEPRSLREIAEAAWNTIETAPDDGADDQSEPPAGQDSRVRDNLGRFAKAGEQSSPDPAPPQNDKTAPPVQPPSPAPTGSSSEAPQHWSAEDKATFAKLPKEGQDFLLKRHNEMERDYQSKVQANATAVQFTQAVAPVFEHPSVTAALIDYQTGGRVHPVDAIKQWAAFHVRAMSKDPNERAGLLRELAQRLQLDPAAVFGQSNQSGNGLSEEDMKDPAIRYFADHVGKTSKDLQALRDQLQEIGRQQTERASQESLRVIGWGIDQFADEKDAQGNLLHPHFDAVLPQVIELFQANPQRDLREAYEAAVWMNPQLRSTLIQQERQSVEQKAANERAAKAARMNVRGRTSPVAKPGAEGDKPKGLRAVISAAADEVGL
jgi:hypothetical protein